MAPVLIEDNFKAEFTPCSNIMVVGDDQRFLACLITLKVDVDVNTGNPTQGVHDGPSPTTTTDNHCMLAETQINQVVHA